MTAYRLCLALIAALLGTGCDQSPRALPPPPEVTRPLPGKGPHETRLGLVVADVRRRLAAGGVAEPSVRSLAVPVGTGWDEMVGYYSRELGGEWKPAADLPPSGFAYHFAAWRAPGKIFTIAFIETPDPEGPTPFRILVEATSAR
jgi:hypothetical protein